MVNAQNSGWKVEAQAASTPKPAPVATKPVESAPVSEAVEDDDLPF